ncbi:MAG: hypothetical protein ACOCXM_05075 [Myxococcota bacterium]
MEASGDFEVSTEKWPVVVVRYPKSVPEGGYKVLFEKYRELAAHGEKIAWLIDFLEFDPVWAPAKVRKEVADLFAEHREILLECTLAEARVVVNPLSRGVLTAFDWLTGHKWPTRNFATFEQAEAWIAEQRYQAAS